ncbi:hypothetical protein B0H12DRAFT_840919 [Mycena haematopus]|nr:hypothetical protein B0H12DRAFT_840919 [Mycena haematopus]
MSQPSTPSRVQSGGSRLVSSRRGRLEGPSSESTPSTPAGTSRCSPRTPRRSAAASAPSTNARSRVQPTQTNSNSREATSPVFTPTNRPRHGQLQRQRAQSPVESAPRPFYSEEEDEEFPTLLLNPEPEAGSKSLTKIAVGWWKSPIKVARERAERAEQRKEIKARREWKKRRELEGKPRHKNHVVIPAGAEVIELTDSSDEELPSSSPCKRKRSTTQDSPRKKARPPSVIYISCGEETDTPAPRPATTPPVSDVEGIWTGGDTTVDTMADMTLDDPIPLDQGMILSQAAAIENLPNGADTTTVEMPWTEDQIEDARVFDAALASVTRELEDSPALSAKAPWSTHTTEPSSTEYSALRGPGVPSSPLLTSLPTPPSPVSDSSNTHQLTPSASDPVLRSPSLDTKPPSPWQATTPPYLPFSSRCALHESPFRGTKFDGVGPTPPPCYKLYVWRDSDPEPQTAANNTRDRGEDGSPPRRDLEPELHPEQELVQGATTPDAGEGHDCAPRCDPEAALKPAHVATTTVETREGYSTGQEYSSPARALEPEPGLEPTQLATTMAAALCGDLTGRDDFVPTHDQPEVANTHAANPSDGYSTKRDDTTLRRDFTSDPEPVQVGTPVTNACNGYSPPPMSPTSDSTLGGTPPIGDTGLTNFILPLALAAAHTSSMKVDIVLCEEDDDDGDELQLWYPS